MPKVAMMSSPHVGDAMDGERLVQHGKAIDSIMTPALGKRWGRGIQWGWGNICDLPGQIDLRSQLFFNLGIV